MPPLAQLADTSAGSSPAQQETLCAMRVPDNQARPFFGVSSVSSFVAMTYPSIDGRIALAERGRDCRFKGLKIISQPRKPGWSKSRSADLNKSLKTKAASCPQLRVRLNKCQAHNPVDAHSCAIPENSRSKLVEVTASPR